MSNVTINMPEFEFSILEKGRLEFGLGTGYIIFGPGSVKDLDELLKNVWPNGQTAFNGRMVLQPTHLEIHTTHGIGTISAYNLDLWIKPALKAWIESAVDETVEQEESDVVS